MDPKTAQILLGAAGAAGAGEALYVDDVFRTFLYDGNGGTQTVTNNIDLSGEGGLVWIKGRDGSAADQMVFDTERGVQKTLVTNGSGQEITRSTSLTAFNSNGFSLGGYVYTNGNSGSPFPTEFCSWTFRKAPGFFDIVTYTGDGTNNRNISHNLGSAPGMIVYKALSSVGGDGSGDHWLVDHRSLTSSKSLRLDETVSERSVKLYWLESKRFDASVLNLSGNVNHSGVNYVAYVFGHDDQSFGTNGDEAIIKCGSYTGNINSGPTVDLGFEPQWILTRSADTSGPEWYLFDTMREWTSEGAVKYLSPNTSGAEGQLGSSSGSEVFKVSSQGFEVISQSTEFNKTNDKFIYVAIRRPNKPVDSATDVYKAFFRSSFAFMDTGFDVDMNFLKRTTGYGDPQFSFRLTRDRRGFHTNSTDVPSLSGSSYRTEYDNNNGLNDLYSSQPDSYVVRHDLFRRAPGFLDVAPYVGNGTNGQVVKHNLGVEPELLIIKNTDQSQSWFVCANLTSSGFDLLNLDNNYTHQARTYPALVTSKPTATSITFTGGSFNDNNKDFLAITFASLDGISKVGTYSGTGSNINVDCGFTAGARFVLIKRVATSGNWYTWNSDRGIVSGNDPYLWMNSSNPEVSNQDYIDPLNAGFTVTSSAPAELNTSGGTYLFLAIA